MTVPEPPAIELVGVAKSFGAVRANHDINLRIARGSIHGIVGENGAGKSTLMSILYGFYQADAGQIRVNGREVAIPDSRVALSLGIAMVHQHFMLVEPFTVLENVILGAEGGLLTGPALTKARAELDRLGRAFDLVVDPDAVTGTLSVGELQRVEILKALYRGADVLILDEPTGVLTPAEADHLFRVLRILKEQGKTVVLITHKLREIMAVTDAVTVMRAGTVVATKATADTDVAELAGLMVGRRVLLTVEKGPASPGRPVLEEENLVVRDARGVTRVKDVSLTVRAGEIVGIAGVAGNGQSELMEALAGILKPVSGSVRIDEQKSAGNPHRVRGQGLAHVPEDRHRMGLVTAFAASENAVLGYQSDPALGAGPLMSPSAVRAVAEAAFAAYDVRPPDVRLKTALFSGGNQQKIVLAREIERDPVVLVVGQPTRGVDIGAIEFIHQRLVRLRDAGKGILLISVELDEIRALSDRILVMFDGRIVGEREGGADERSLGLLMAGIDGEAA